MLIHWVKNTSNLKKYNVKLQEAEVLVFLLQSRGAPWLSDGKTESQQ